MWILARKRYKPYAHDWVVYLLYLGCRSTLFGLYIYFIWAVDLLYLGCRSTLFGL